MTAELRYWYLENTNGGSSKFYEICLLDQGPTGPLVSFRWGKIGAIGAMGIARHGYSVANNKLSAKLNGGYVEKKNRTVTVPTLLEEELADAMMLPNPAVFGATLKKILDPRVALKKILDPRVAGQKPTLTILDEALASLADRINALIPTAVGNPEGCFAEFGSVKEEMQKMRKELQAAEDQFSLLEAIMTERMTA